MAAAQLKRPLYLGGKRDFLYSNCAVIDICYCTMYVCKRILSAASLFPLSAAAFGSVGRQAGRQAVGSYSTATTATAHVIFMWGGLFVL